LFQQVKGRGSGYRSFAEFIGEMFMPLFEVRLAQNDIFSFQ
jgi:hypothetical protein